MNDNIQDSLKNQKINNNDIESLINLIITTSENVIVQIIKKVYINYFSKKKMK